MISVCEKCQEGFEREPPTMCADCCSSYHQRCWDALDECPVCAEREREAENG